MTSIAIIALLYATCAPVDRMGLAGWLLVSLAGIVALLLIDPPTYEVSE